MALYFMHAPVMGRCCRPPPASVLFLTCQRFKRPEYTRNYILAVDMQDSAPGAARALPVRPFTPPHTWGAQSCCTQIWLQVCEDAPAQLEVRLSVSVPSASAVLVPELLRLLKHSHKGVRSGVRSVFTWIQKHWPEGVTLSLQHSFAASMLGVPRDYEP